MAYLTIATQYFVSSVGDHLEKAELSSGEQHELVILYQLLFRTKPNSIVLIDEPETSLHLVWQMDFLQDIQRIMDLTPFAVIITTHSPHIIHDRWDLTVELKATETGHEVPQQSIPYRECWSRNPKKNGRLISLFAKSRTNWLGCLPKVEQTG